MAASFFATKNRNGEKIIQNIKRLNAIKNAKKKKKKSKTTTQKQKPNINA